jgi:hypothetical protein
MIRVVLYGVKLDLSLYGKNRLRGENTEKMSACNGDELTKTWRK